MQVWISTHFGRIGERELFPGIVCILGRFRLLGGGGQGSGFWRFLPVWRSGGLILVFWRKGVVFGGLDGFSAGFGTPEVVSEGSEMVSEVTEVVSEVTDLSLEGSERAGEVTILCCEVTESGPGVTESAGEVAAGRAVVTVGRPAVAPGRAGGNFFWRERLARRAAGVLFSRGSTLENLTRVPWLFSGFAGPFVDSGATYDDVQGAGSQLTKENESEAGSGFSHV